MHLLDRAIVVTNALTDWENCQFLDGNATADNMYYGQKLNNCVFNGVGKVMEYYQGNGYTNSSLMENCLITNISEVAGPGNVHVDCAITGAMTNRTMPTFTFFNNRFYDNVGMEFFSLNAAENVSFISNSFSGSGPGINLTGIGQQPTDGTQVWYMTNILVVGNSFNCPSPLSIGYSEVEDMVCSNNVGFTLTASIGYATNNILSGNSGISPNNSIYYDLGTGPGSPPHGVIESGQYFIDLTNNNWAIPTSDTIDGGDYYPTDSVISYGNGPVHLLRSTGAIFYLDDLHPGMNPAGATLQVYAATWHGGNVTNFYLSGRLPGHPMTITNDAPPVTFYWAGSGWTVGYSIPYTDGPTNGVSRLAVQFSSPGVDINGNNITNWSWNFGDGTTGTAQNPLHIYTNIGTFFASLTVTDAVGIALSGSVTAITVTNPIIQFTQNPTVGVSRLNVQFKSPSVDSGTNAIKSWFWNFGDGTTGTGENPAHSYTNLGTFYPVLTVTNVYGLSATSSGGPITVTNPIVQFTEKPTIGVSRLNVQFSSPSVDSATNAIKSWYWNFGDGSIGTTENPLHIYTNTGTFYPVLVITNIYGISAASPSVTIAVTNPIVQFTEKPTIGALRLNVQFSSPSVDSATNAIGSWYWNFGDGSIGTTENPSHIYTNTGTFYPVLVITNIYGITAASPGVTITVTNPAIRFTESATVGVSRLTIQFNSPGTDSGTNAIGSWYWNFGDGSSGTTESPSHIYTNTGTFYPMLTVTNVYGIVSANTNAAITVTNPAIKFTATPTNAGRNVVIQFTAPNTDSGTNAITSWQWNFGDGAVSTLQNPTHSYTNLGTYYPVLTVENIYGLQPTSSGPAVNVGNPSVSFSATPSNGVSLLKVQFQSPASDNLGEAINIWQWNFGDGSTGLVENPAHIYTNIGTFYPMLTVSNSAGIWLTNFGAGITVTNPIIEYTATPTKGNGRVTVRFASPSLDSGSNTIRTWNWNFGDGQSGTGENPLHTYTSAGTFQPILMATNVSGLSPTSVGPAIIIKGVNGAAGQTEVNSPPPLTIAMSGANAILKWPTNGNNFTLQYSTDPASANAWTDIGSSPVVIGVQDVITITNFTSAPRMFFRLKQ